MDTATFLVQCLNAVQYGLLLFLVASGLTLIFGIMGVINLAHGSFYMLGAYLAFASKGGADDDPAWADNFRQHPEVELQDKAEKHTYTVRELSGDERDDWWQHAVATWPTYASYQEKTDRLIPLFLLERA